MYELRQLEQLIAVAEYGTLSAAAEELHISQPALTRSMQKLEEELGVPLFDHGKNRIRLNEYGDLAVKLARQVVDAADYLTVRVQDLARSRLTIAVGSDAPGPMWEAAAALNISNPDMTVKSEIKPEEALVTGLLDGQYQVIITDRAPEHPRIESREYIVETMWVSLPEDHPLAGRKDGIWLSDLKGQTMVMYADPGIWSGLREQKMSGIRLIAQAERETPVESADLSALPSFVSSLTMKHMQEQPHRVCLKVLDPEAEIQFYLCCLRKNSALMERIIGK